MVSVGDGWSSRGVRVGRTVVVGGGETPTTSAVWKCLQTTIVGQELEPGLGREVYYNLPSCFSISWRLLEADLYEERTMWVAEFLSPGDEEVLFARQRLSLGYLVCLLSGSKIYIDTRRSLQFGDEKWSDFKINFSPFPNGFILTKYQSFD